MTEPAAPTYHGGPADGRRYTDPAPPSEASRVKRVYVPEARAAGLVRHCYVVERVGGVVVGLSYVGTG